ncbi:MAG: ATP-binding protein, partial [Bacteroidaceae bacterium]|nr:ATP-binding protein [Bacteroidaceae bacterium]
VPNIKAITPTCSQMGLATGNVPYRIEDAIYDMRINERSNNQDISISRLSSGSRRIITIIAEIIKAEMTGSSLICMEELENSVHPKLLENMILMVQSFAEGIKVLTTSHSPYLVRYLKSRQLTFGLPTEEGVASFHKLKQTKVKTVVKRASAMEMTLGEYMFDLMLNLKPESEEITELFD